MKILIAEDNLMMQRSVGMMMKYWGFDYDLANNGQEAVDRAIMNKGAYDLCLMDIDMPIMNGCEAAMTIRHKVEYFPIMALSGNGSIEERYAQAGMDDYLAKPYEINQLLGKINELTVKALRVDNENGNFDIKKEKPMDAEQLKMLKELAKKDLALLIVESGQQRFVVHKNIQNKMSHVLIGEGKELFEFLDRSENPANCHLYKGNMQTNRLLLTPEQFEERLKNEDSDINNFSTKIDQELSEEKKK